MEECNVAANTISYSTVISAYANARPSRPADGERILARMEAKGVLPNTVTYNSIIKAYANERCVRPEACEKILVSMQNKGIKPDIIVHKRDCCLCQSQTIEAQ